MEALNFCRHILSVEELGSVVSSRRCMGTTSSDVPHVAQAEPLKVDRKDPKTKTNSTFRRLEGGLQAMPSGREELKAVESVNLVSQKSESESGQAVCRERFRRNK